MSEFSSVLLSFSAISSNDTSPVSFSWGSDEIFSDCVGASEFCNSAKSSFDTCIFSGTFLALFEGKIGADASNQWLKYNKLRPDYEQYTADLKYIEKRNKKLEAEYEKKLLENAEELTKQQIELDAVALEKQKLVDEMNKLKGKKNSPK